jgi:hypothetical protein
MRSKSLRHRGFQLVEIILQRICNCQQPEQFRFSVIVRRWASRSLAPTGYRAVLHDDFD